MVEQKYQKKITDFLEKQGAYVVKVITANKKGVPDIIACLNGRFIAIEVKTPTTRNNLSMLQQHNLDVISIAEGISMSAVEVEEVETVLRFEGLI